MMRVIVLGATGAMGRRAALELHRSNGISRLTLAGRNDRKLNELAKKLDGNVDVAVVRADQRQSLISAMQDHDVAAGAVGPFYAFEKTIAEAAIEAGVHYVSINDDHDATEDVLTLDDAARRSGITIVPGAGWTPGLTSLMAKKGTTLLDKADAVHIAWVGSASDARGFAVILHTLHIMSGRVPTFREGRRTSVRAGSGAQTVRFPDPIGRVTVYHVGHPEPITVPRFIPGLNEVTLRGGLTEPLLNTLGRWMTRTGITRTRAGKTRVARMMQPFISVLGAVGRPPALLSGAHVHVAGTKSGRPASVTLTAVGRMQELTALPHAVTTLMVGRGLLARAGVFPLEADAGPDPDRFFEALALRGITVAVDERLA